ncbi:MAG: site-2 protease family protein [Actinomycetota bacterium]|nr:site-2 protease family protein [Actinomycetota bacterium]
MSFGIIIFIVSILLVVMIHESGHLLMAKLFNFKAPQFFVGFGPTLWSFKRGETEYGIKAIPAGGFVKIVGMNPYETVPPEDQPRAYGNKPRWQRALVLVAGSATHFVIAFIVLLITAMTIGFPADAPSREIAAISEQSAASEAGLEPGDVIVAVDGDEVQEWAEVSSFIQEHPAEDVVFTVERDGDRVDVEATIGRALFDEAGPVASAAADEELRAPRPGEELRGFMGIEPDIYETYSLPAAVGKSGSLVWQISRDSITQGIPKIFTPIFNGDLFAALGGEERTAEDPIGVVGAGRIAGQSVESGRYLELIMLIVFFTIFVGILNLMPLPPLDGGHLAVVAYEAITGRTVDIRKLIPVAAAVISFFVLLFFAVLYLDIARPVDIPF